MERRSEKMSHGYSLSIPLTDSEKSSGGIGLKDQVVSRERLP